MKVAAVLRDHDAIVDKCGRNDQRIIERQLRLMRGVLLPQFPCAVDDVLCWWDGRREVGQDNRVADGLPVGRFQVVEDLVDNHQWYCYILTADPVSRPQTGVANGRDDTRVQQIPSHVPTRK